MPLSWRTFEVLMIDGSKIQGCQASSIVEAESKSPIQARPFLEIPLHCEYGVNIYNVLVKAHAKCIVNICTKMQQVTPKEASPRDR
jgi:hypothetical protein